MMCYRDRTYCSFYMKCKDGLTCGRALTPEIIKAADEWWGSPGGAPICEFVDEPECMVKYITIWYKLDEKSGEYKHNHIEDGWIKGIYPIAKSPEQKKSWKNATWMARFAFLENGKVVDEKA